MGTLRLKEGVNSQRLVLHDINSFGSILKMKKNSLMNSLFGILPPLLFDKPSTGGVVAKSDDASGKDSQLTGVARYLQKLEPAVEEANITGVAKYLAQQQALEEANKPVIEESDPEVESADLELELVHEDEETLEVQEAQEVEAEDVLEVEEEIVELEPVISGVEKYLSLQNENPVTRVAKYFIRQAIQAREAPVTGVAKYVTMQEHDGHVVTGVAKYVTQQGLRESSALSVTGVAKYVLKNDLLAKDAPVATSVAKYVSKQTQLAKDALWRNQSRNKCLRPEWQSLLQNRLG
jgi:hypothetical protein